MAITARRLATPSSVNAAIKQIADVMRRANYAGALQYVPELSWILFLRILDEREELLDDHPRGHRSQQLRPQGREPEHQIHGGHANARGASRQHRGTGSRGRRGDRRASAPSRGRLMAASGDWGPLAPAERGLGLPVLLDRTLTC